MNAVRSLLSLIVFLFLLALIIRLVFDWIQVFSRDWKPKGIVLVLAEAVYSVTDPPLRALRRVIPPLRLGSVQLDLAFTLLFLVTIIVYQLL